MHARGVHPDVALHVYCTMRSVDPPAYESLWFPHMLPADAIQDREPVAF